MYKFKYKHKIIQSLKDYNDLTTLNVIFDFSSEVAEKNREEVKKRCDFRTKMVDVDGGREQNIGQLNRYLFDSGVASNFEMTDTLFPSQGYYGGRIYFTISQLKFGFGLGIKLTVEARGHLPLEEMFDIDSLDHFILTGQPKYVTEQDNFS